MNKSLLYVSAGGPGSELGPEVLLAARGCEASLQQGQLRHVSEPWLGVFGGREVGSWAGTGPTSDMDYYLTRAVFLRLNPRRPGDLKEAFNTSCLSSDTVISSCRRQNLLVLWLINKRKSDVLIEILGFLGFDWKIIQSFSDLLTDMREPDRVVALLSFCGYCQDEKNVDVPFNRLQTLQILFDHLGPTSLCNILPSQL